MSEFEFDQNAYLQRLNYTGDTNVTFEDLKALHHAQQHTIPFENFDIQLGRSIDLDPPALLQKLVHKRRGGYCFELNGLFLLALKSFGFAARPLLGRVHVTGIPSGRGHQISLITLQGEQYIADVGFGAETPRAPLPLRFDQPTSQHGQTTRLLESEQFGIMLQTYKGDHWQNLYSFDLGYVHQGDIKYGNHYTSTHPDSLFVFARVAALPIDNGVVTLFNHTLKRSFEGAVTEMQLPEGRAYLDALQTHFGIEFAEPYAALRPLPD